MRAKERIELGRIAHAREHLEAVSRAGFRRCRDTALLFARVCVALLLLAAWLAGEGDVWAFAAPLAGAAFFGFMMLDAGRFAVIWARFHRRATGRWPWRET